MKQKREATPDAVHATDPGLTAAEAVRTQRKASRAAKTAAAPTKGAAKKPGMSDHADRRKNAFGIAASASKATAVSRAIISRARGGRKR